MRFLLGGKWFDGVWKEVIILGGCLARMLWLSFFDAA